MNNKTKDKWTRSEDVDGRPLLPTEPVYVGWAVVVGGREAVILRDARKGDPLWGSDDDLIVVQYTGEDRQETVKKGKVTAVNEAVNPTPATTKATVAKTSTPAQVTVRHIDEE